MGQEFSPAVPGSPGSAGQPDRCPAVTDLRYCCGGVAEPGCAEPGCAEPGSALPGSAAAPGSGRFASAACFTWSSRLRACSRWLCTFGSVIAAHCSTLAGASADALLAAAEPDVPTAPDVVALPDVPLESPAWLGVPVVDEPVALDASPEDDVPLVDDVPEVPLVASWPAVPAIAV
jgi:hypothetical protein